MWKTIRNHFGTPKRKLVAEQYRKREEETRRSMSRSHSDDGYSSGYTPMAPSFDSSPSWSIPDTSTPDTSSPSSDPGFSGGGGDSGGGGASDNF